MKGALDAFLASLPSSESILARQSEAAAAFGYFLGEVQQGAITPKLVGECYAAAGLRAPKNISDTMSRSGAFVRNGGAWSLHRDAVAKFRALRSDPPDAGDVLDAERQKTVLVVYGRDDDARRDVFSFLRSLRLIPIEWNDAVHRTGKASPYVGEILSAAFSMAQAFLVLMTPDEEAVLRPGLRTTELDAGLAYQPRPDVLLEGGMALAHDESRTILVSIGAVREISDLGGRHVIRLNNSSARRNDLVQRLKIAHCTPNTDGTDWLSEGDFERGT